MLIVEAPSQQGSTHRTGRQSLILIQRITFMFENSRNTNRLEQRCLTTQHSDIYFGQG